MEKEKILETIKNIQKCCNELANEGIKCVFAAGSNNVGLYLSTSVPMTEIHFFVCDVVQSVRIAQEKEQAEEEMKKDGSKIIPFMPKGEA